MGRQGIDRIASAEKTVQSYLASNLSASDGHVVFPEPEINKEAFIRSVELKNKYDELSTKFDVLSPIKVDIKFCSRRRFLSWRIFVSVARYDGITIFSTTTWDYNEDRYPIDPGIYQASLLIPGKFLGPTNYLLSVAIGEPPIKRHDFHENIIQFEVLGKSFDYGRDIGMLAYPFDWQISTISEQ